MLIVMKQIIKKSLIIWCCYLLFSVGLLGVDYLFRLKQGYIQRSSSWVSLSSEGIPIEIHTVLLLIAGGVSLFFLLKTMKGIQHVFLRYLFFFFQSVCGFLVTLILWLYYVTETGIDSL
jgi:hypothetical protein